MARRITKDYIEQYDEIEFTQPLAHGKYIKQVYSKFPAGWRVLYTSNSAHHICPYDGVFRNCADCGALEEDFDVQFCIDKVEMIDTAALVGRIKDCMKAGLEVNFS